MPKKVFEVVIIGAGIQGLSVASHLIKAGMNSNDIIVIERGVDLPSFHSETERSAAMIMMQVHTLQEEKNQFSLAAYDEYTHFYEHYGYELKFTKCGSVLYTTNHITGEELAKSAEEQSRLGIDSKVISPSDLKKKVKFLNTSDIDTAIYCPMDGYIDQLEAVKGFKLFLKSKKTRIQMKSEVKGIRVEKQKVVAVITQDRELATKRVVNAAGLFAGRIGNMVGAPIHLRKKTRTLWHAPADGIDITNMPILEDVKREWYMRPAVDVEKRILIGVGPIDDVAGDLDNEDNFKARHEEETNAYLAYRVPGLKGAIVYDGSSGIRDLSDDELPILGPIDDVEGIDEVEGFINCCGFSGYGIMHAPISGQLIANYIVNNKEELEIQTADRAFKIYLKNFLLSRFKKQTLEIPGKW
jgi:sarcosine oxidase subunit beta